MNIHNLGVEAPRVRGRRAATSFQCGLALWLRGPLTAEMQPQARKADRLYEGGGIAEESGRQGKLGISSFVPGFVGVVRTAP